MNKNKRQLVKIIEEISEDKQIELKTFSDNWILKLTKNNKSGYIIGYKFPLNNASINYICDDKSAMCDVLMDLNIPTVKRYYFEKKDFSDESNNRWNELEELLNKHKVLVCQRNSGSGGRNVYKCDDIDNLKDRINKLFSRNRSICISPCESIINEYRVIIEGDEVQLIYNKQRPKVVGDNKHTISELIKMSNFNKKIELLKDLDLNRIPKTNEIVEISWKHNLGQGALPEIVEEENLFNELSDFAVNVAKKINLKFASIDIIRDDADNLKVLEINSGVMMETFSSLSVENYDLSKKIYEKAILDFLDR